MTGVYSPQTTLLMLYNVRESMRLALVEMHRYPKWRRPLIFLMGLSQISKLIEPNQRRS
jgi:hypothetical protein